MKKFLWQWTPPAIVSFYKRVINKVGYSGNYSNWDDAKKDSTGYHADLILRKVKYSLLKVKSGEAAYERDSVLFEEVQYSWPLLAGLLWIASCNANRLNLLDFGGSLGSSYFQNRAFLLHLNEFSWNVVEQENFVRCGREFFEDQFLKFYFTIDECLEARHPDAIFLGSVIQYLERPYDFLREVISNKFPFIIFDRTPFINGNHARLTVQRVPPEIYPASYPAWFFCRDSFKRIMSEHYDLIAEFNTNDQANINAQFKGFIYKYRC